MDEVLQETEKTDEKRGSWVVITVSVLVAVYFLFPALYYYPVYLAYRHSSEPPYMDAALNIFFYPVEKLAKAFPAYDKLLERELDLLGIR